MRRYLLAVFFSLILFLILVNYSFALVAPPSKTGLNFLGQDHYYSVTFRGNGEAIVNLKVILSNLQDTPLSTVALRVPKVDPKDIMVYQVVREPQCIRYQSESPVEIQQQIYPMPPRKPAVCEEYQDPDYYQYWWGENKYQKAQYELSGDTIIIGLPKKIDADKSGSFIVYYRALGYAKKNIVGAYNFVLETLKVNDKIRDLQVGINTDSDLYLRDAKGKVNYRFDETSFASLRSTEKVGVIKNSQFDNYYQQIGQGTIIKKASNLQLLDSYTVKGKYADSFLKLYAKEILMVVMTVVVLVFLLIVLIKFLARRLNEVKASRQLKQNQNLPSIDTTGILIVLGVSFASSIFMAAFTVFLLFLAFIVNTYSYLGDLALILTVFLVIVSVAIYGLLLVAPGIYLGIKKGIWWGMGVFALTIFWLGCYLIVVFLVLSLRGNRSSPQIPIPLIQQESINSGELKKK